MLTKEHVAQDRRIDSTLALSQEGYLFIKNRVDKYNSNIFQSHLFGEEVICMTGEDAAKLFYDPQRFQRNGAAPKRVQKTLFGENAVQGMDGEAHKHRKALFMSVMTPEHQKRLAQLMMEKMEASISKWQVNKEIVLFDETKEMLCQVVCQWAGVPLDESEIKSRAEDFDSMIDGFGGVGPRYWKGKMARTRAEEWIAGIVEDLRSGKLQVEESSVLYTMAFHKELDGKYMNSQITAIELINVLRPIVAISTFITFAALALHKHPECKEKLLSGDANYLEMFVQEVRRYYPFTPFLGARVLKDFTLDEWQFKQGMLVILDIYGANHDPQLWERPNEFYPEHFKQWNGDLFNFIPQGGGDASKTHRCPGEGITVEIMKACVEFLVKKIEFNVPDQDLSYSLVRVPSLPESGFIMRDIKKKV